MSARPGSRKRWIAGAALLCVAALLLSLGGCIDEPLTPAASALFTPPVEPLPTDNGFVLLMGLDAPLDADPRARGADWVRQVNEAATKRTPYTPASSRIAVRGSEDVACVPDEFDCVARVRSSNPVWIEEYVRDNQVLLSRYRALMREADFSEHGTQISLDVPLYPLAKVGESQRIHLAEAALRFSQGQADTAIRMLEAENAFLRRLMGQSGTLIAKLVALRCLLRNVLLASEIAREPSMTPSGLDALERMTAPLSHDVTALGRSLHHEARIMPELLDRVDDMRPATVAELTRGDTSNIRPEQGSELPTFLARHFFARNATLNFFQPVYETWESLDAVDTRDIVPASKRAFDAATDHVKPGITWIYNPGGRWLMKGQVFDLSTYYLRLRDADAVVRAVGAQVAARRASVGPAGMKDFLARSEARYSNPYTAKPFEWDAGAKQIWFKPAAERTAQFGIGGRKDRVGIRVAD